MTNPATDEIAAPVDQHSSQAIHTRTIDTITAIPAEQWNQLCTDVYFSHEWLKTLEEVPLGRIKPQHILVYDGSRLIAILPGFVQSEDFFTSLDHKLLGPIAPLARLLGVSFMPAYVGYSFLHFSNIYFRESKKRDVVFARIDDALRKIGKAHCVRSVAFYVNGNHTENIRDFTSRYGYNRLFFGYGTILRLDNIDQFDDYLTHAKRKYGKKVRENIRWEMNLFRRGGLRIEELQEVKTEEPILRQLYQENLDAHLRVKRTVPDELFSCAKRNLKDKLYITVAKKDDEIRGFNCGLIGGDAHRRAYYGLYVGYDRADRRNRTYFYTAYYDPISKGIQDGWELVHEGTGAYDVKMRRGFDAEPVHLMIRPHGPLLRVLLGILTPFISLWYKRKHRIVRRFNRRQERLTKPA